jgi:hypothetical protein
MVAMVIDTFGVRLATTAADMRGQYRAGSFFWLDIFAGDDAARTGLLRELGLESSDIAWALRFEQAGRMYIGRDTLRVVTWMADPAGNVREVRVFSCPNCVLTVWRGDAMALDEIRQQFGERVEGLDNSRYAAAGILLQLLVGTLYHAVQVWIWRSTSCARISTKIRRRRSSRWSRAGCAGCNRSWRALIATAAR